MLSFETRSIYKDSVAKLKLLFTFKYAKENPKLIITELEDGY